MLWTSAGSANAGLEGPQTGFGPRPPGFGTARPMSATGPHPLSGNQQSGETGPSGRQSLTGTVPKPKKSGPQPASGTNSGFQASPKQTGSGRLASLFEVNAGFGAGPQQPLFGSGFQTGNPHPESSAWSNQDYEKKRAIPGEYKTNLLLSISLIIILEWSGFI